MDYQLWFGWLDNAAAAAEQCLTTNSKSKPFWSFAKVKARTVGNHHDITFSLGKYGEKETIVKTVVIVVQA